MKILEDYKKIMHNFVNEDDDEASGRIDMDDPLMQKKGWYKDNPELTIGGALKQGEKHPAYKDAMQLVDKEKGKDSGEDDSKKLSGKSDFSRDGGDDKPKADEPKGADKIVGKRRNAEEAASELASITADVGDGQKMGKGVARQVAQHEADILAQQGINKSPDGTYSTSDYDEDEDEVIYKPMSEEGVINAIAQATGRTPNEIANMRDAAKKANPGVFPKSGDDRDAQNQKEAKDKVLNKEGKKSKKPFLKEQLERFGGLK